MVTNKYYDNILIALYKVSIFEIYLYKIFMILEDHGDPRNNFQGRAEFCKYDRCRFLNSSYFFEYPKVVEEVVDAQFSSF